MEILWAVIQKSKDLLIDCSMIITTATVIIVQALVVSWIVFTTPEPCPRKYRVTQENGGVLAQPSDIFRYCELDYGAKWVLKDENREEEK